MMFAENTMQNDWLSQTSNTQSWNPMLSSSFQLQPTPPPSKAFWPKGVQWSRLSLLRKCVASTLKAFPNMMLSQSSIPPFIHHTSMKAEKVHDELSEPGALARCAGIMAVWTIKNRNNKHYIWKIIRKEQERFLEESTLYNDFEVVTGLQAVVIYFLLRISVGDDEDANFDIPLIQTMSKLTQKARGMTVKYCDPASQIAPKWENWILIESLRRTLSIIFIIGFLFDLTPDNGYCETTRYFSELLLPSAKSI